MPTKNPVMSLGNAFVKMLLRSPLHAMFSKNMMLVTVKGCKSGKFYSTPVNYVQDGDQLYVTSQKDRSWWRNLRGGAQAILCLRGKDTLAEAVVLEEEPGVTAQLAAYLAKTPQYARNFGVSHTSEGVINLEETARAAKNRVVVIFKIKEPAV
jgi:deazaflavin-dependent oxidoreductase (nitroreductase family)